MLSVVAFPFTVAKYLIKIGKKNLLWVMVPEGTAIMVGKAWWCFWWQESVAGLDGTMTRSQG